jgi:hypothetical protein
MKIVITATIDLDNVKVTNAIASVVNSAFETGLNPAWFQVDSPNKDGFLDAAFADQSLETPSKKPAKTNWTLMARLNDGSYKSDWVVLTPEHCVKQWIKMSNDKELFVLDRNAKAYLNYLVLLSKGEEKKAESVLLYDYEPDGVHDDALAQYAIAGEVVFG